MPPTESEFLALKSRISELEEKLQFLYRRLNMDYATASSSDPMSPIREALRRGDKIGAIKIYRELNGVGLAEAKRAIDELESGPF